MKSKIKYRFKRENNIGLIALIIVFLVSCSEKNAAVKEVNASGDGIIMNQYYSKCIEYFYEDGRKYKKICTSDQFADDMSFIEYIYENDKLIYIKDYTSPDIKDTLFLYPASTDSLCFSAISQERGKKRVICLDSTKHKIIKSQLYYGEPYDELFGIFYRYRYNKEGLVYAAICYIEHGPQELYHYYYKYTKFDERQNWIEREVYSSVTYLNEEGGEYIDHLSQEEQIEYFDNAFPTGPLERGPKIEKREITYY